MPRGNLCSLNQKSFWKTFVRAAAKILEFSSGKTLNDYTNDALLHSGVERQFEIIGEALNRLSKADPHLTSQIHHHQHIISFRNVLIHGYDIVEDPIVWDVVTKDLPVLHEQVRKLLDEKNSQ